MSTTTRPKKRLVAIGPMGQGVRRFHQSLAQASKPFFSPAHPVRRRRRRSPGAIAMSPAAASPDDRIRSYEDFARVHAYLLAASGIPPSLHQRLYHKLADEVFDGGEAFSVEPCEGGRQRRLVLAAEWTLGRESDVFLVDHAWSFRLSDALKQVLILSLGPWFTSVESVALVCWEVISAILAAFVLPSCIMAHNVVYY